MRELLDVRLVDKLTDLIFAGNKEVQTASNVPDIDIFELGFELPRDTLVDLAWGVVLFREVFELLRVVLNPFKIFPILHTSHINQLSEELVIILTLPEHHIMERDVVVDVPLIRDHHQPETLDDLVEYLQE